MEGYDDACCGPLRVRAGKWGDRYKKGSWRLASRCDDGIDGSHVPPRRVSAQCTAPAHSSTLCTAADVRASYRGREYAMYHERKRAMYNEQGGGGREGVTCTATSCPLPEPLVTLPCPSSRSSGGLDPECPHMPFPFPLCAAKHPAPSPHFGLTSSGWHGAPPKGSPPHPLSVERAPPNTLPSRHYFSSILRSVWPGTPPAPTTRRPRLAALMVPP